MKLRNCPLCGSNVIHYYEQGLARHNELEWWFIEQPESSYECEECGHMVFGRSEEEAKETWNKAEVADWERAWWNVAQTRRRKLNDYTSSEEK